MNHSDMIMRFLDENFNEKKCLELSLKNQFIKRSSSKLKGHEFIKTMIIPSPGLSTDSLQGLCKRMQKFNPEANLSAQALCLRINDASSSRLMKGVFIELLQQLRIHQKINEKANAVYSKFNRILIEDSSCITLNEKLDHIYAGSTRASANIKAQLKIDLIYDLIHGSTVDAALFSGKEPDQALAERVIKHLEPNDLLIRDLGYFTINAFKAIAEAGAYFLSRLMPRVHFYLNKTDEEPLDLGLFLRNKKYKYFNIIEIEGFVGVGKVASRLIIYRQPPEVTNKRLRDSSKYGRNKTLSKSKRLCMQFSIFITNAPTEMLTPALVGTIYRLRWEIELVFKRWKDQLKIDYLSGIKQERIDCLIWSRLCMVLLVELVCGCYKNLAEAKFAREFSEVKLINYLLRENGFLKAVQSNTLEKYLNELEQDICKMLLKDIRQRRTMRERVLLQEPYYQIQATYYQHVA